jgi:hypothetical protein
LRTFTNFRLVFAVQDVGEMVMEGIGASLGVRSEPFVGKREVLS